MQIYEGTYTFLSDKPLENLIKMNVHNKLSIQRKIQRLKIRRTIHLNSIYVYFLQMRYTYIKRKIIREFYRFSAEIINKIESKSVELIMTSDLFFIESGSKRYNFTRNIHFVSKV